MRLDRPAPSTTAAMLRPASAPAPSRGCGRVTISISRPPTPRPVMSSRGTGRPARSRISTQSKPFSFGLRAQPGAPSTGRPPAAPIINRLPGSTGMPKCSMRPPIASSAAGITSRRSAIAEAPNTMASSAPALSTSSSARASAARSCGTRRSATIVAPAGASRSAVIFSVFSITLVGEARQQRRHHADLADAIGRDAQQRLASRRQAPHRARPWRPRTE